MKQQTLAMAVMQNLVQVAMARGIVQLTLETGASAVFASARRLYARLGFVVCGPFGTYRDDPHSCFMTRALPPSTSSGA